MVDISFSWSNPDSNSQIIEYFRTLHTQRIFELRDRKRHILQQQMQTRVQLVRSSQLPLASLSLWPEIMWSDYAHGSSDVFPEEFDSDGGREDGKEGGREGGGQQVTTRTAKSLAWFF